MCGTGRVKGLTDVESVKKQLPADLSQSMQFEYLAHFTAQHVVGFDSSAPDRIEHGSVGFGKPVSRHSRGSGREWTAGAQRLRLPAGLVFLVFGGRFHVQYIDGGGVDRRNGRQV